MLIRTIEQFKAIIAGAQVNLSGTTILPYVEQAQLIHLQPVLGLPILQELEAGLDENRQDEDFLGLLAAVRRALAYFALLEALPFLNVRIGDGGVMEPTAVNAVPTRQWSYQGAEIAAVRNEETFLDAAVSLLERDAAKWPAWSESEACTVLRGQLIPDAATLSRYLNTAGNRRTFLAFRPYLERAEELHLRSLVSGELLDNLKARLVAGRPTPADTGLLQRLRPTLAQLALNEALPELSISLNGAGIQALTDSYVVRQRLASPQEDLEKLAYRARTLSERYLAELSAFLQRNLIAYPDYAESDAYNRPGENPSYQRPDNAGSVSFWV